MNLLRPIAFGVMAASTLAQAQLRPSEKSDTTICPAPGTKEAKEAVVKSSIDNSLSAYFTEKEQERKYGGSSLGEPRRPLTLSSDDIQPRDHHDKFELETRVGFGASGKGDRKAIGYFNDSIMDTHFSVKGRMNFENGTYVGLFGRFNNYFDNVDLVESDRTDESAGAQSAYIGNDAGICEGLGWKASIWNEKDNALGLDQRRRGEFGLTGAADVLGIFKALGVNVKSDLGVYNEDVKFNQSVGGGSETVWGVYCRFEAEAPLTDGLSALARVGGSFEEASSLNEYTWGAGLRCKTVPFVGTALGATTELMYSRLNRDSENGANGTGAYSANGDDDMITLDFIWKF
jgi:hypothetical protein